MKQKLLKHKLAAHARERAAGDFGAGLRHRPDARSRRHARPMTGFSFAVYGDSRSMMYLPYKPEQEARLAS